MRAFTLGGGLLGLILTQSAQAQDLYVSNATGNINKITPGGVFTTFATLPSANDGPYGLAFDKSGNLFAADDGNGIIYKITRAGAVSNFASGFNIPYGLAIDSSDNLFVANAGSGEVSKVTSGGVVSTFASGFSVPTGLALDSTGNLYVANEGNATISKVTSGGTVSTFVSGVDRPYGLAFSQSNDLFTVSYRTNILSEITPGGAVSIFASGGGPSGLDKPVFLAFDTFTTTPEPGTVALLMSGGLAGVGLLKRRSRR